MENKTGDLERWERSISIWILCKLLQESKRHHMGQPRNRDKKRTHSLFVDDLNVYQESHKTLKDVNKMIVQTSNGTGACYGVAKCAKIVF